MITIAHLRDALARVVTSALATAGIDAAVYAQPPTGLTVFPAVIVGRAAWTPGENNWVQEWTVPIEVVVSDPGINPQATIEDLEQLWPVVLAALSDAIDGDQSLGGVCNAAWVARARPGSIVIAGVRYPATAIEIQLHG